MDFGSGCSPRLPAMSSGSSFRLRAAAVAIWVLVFFVSSLHASATIVAVCGLGPIKSTDGGITWSVIPVNVSNGILSGQPALRVVGYDPRTPSTTWYAHGDAGGTYGFYRTTDGGQTWTGTPLLNFIPASIPGSIVVDPGATNVIYMIVYAATPGKNYIVRSTDLGLTWSKIPLPATASYPASSFAGRNRGGLDCHRRGEAMRRALRSRRAATSSRPLISARVGLRSRRASTLRNNNGQPAVALFAL